jgi:UDP-glucose 4-epimerase
MDAALGGVNKGVRMAEGKFPVLVTGGAGYIGSHAVLALRDAGWPVVILDNLVTGFRWAVPEDIPFVEADVGDGNAVLSALKAHNIGAIMHFAGSIIVPESTANPLKYYRNNTANSRSLIESAVHAEVRHLVFSSTAAVYGIPSDEPVSEDYPTQPANPYGTSKLMTEMMLRDVAAAHRFNYCALRYFNVAGADAAGRAGQSTAGATNLIKVASEVAAGTRAELEIYGNDWPTPDGTGVRDFIHVTDLANAHVKALETLIASPTESHTLNCGYGRGSSVLDVVAAVSRASGSNVAHRFLPRRAGDIAMMVADSGALKRRFGWMPVHDDLDVIVASAIEWERTLALRKNQ